MTRYAEVITRMILHICVDEYLFIFQFSHLCGTVKRRSVRNHVLKASAGSEIISGMCLQALIKTVGNTQLFTQSGILWTKQCVSNVALGAFLSIS